MKSTTEDRDDHLNDIAIVGMDVRVPGAATLDRFWQNLRSGVESITFFSPDPPVVRSGMAHVKAAPVLEDIELFDAAFFGFNPREAEAMDPQIRLFLDCCWTALEAAGYDATQYGGRIGVFGGSALSTYLTRNLLQNPEALRAAGAGITSLGVFNDRDSLASIVAYKFDLTGPAVTVQTFCSTSLVAVHLACQSLLNGESDLALAGASSINVGLADGYIYQESGILSPDGHCRTFDAKAAGTVFGNGVGVVVLKRMADALAERDTIHAVIRGSAINNDGAQKAGYTAPSVGGQAKAIAEAMAVAQVEADTISYVEAHGTATALGDPIEIEALTRAFRAGTDRKRYCAIGSVKTNFGHLDRASGIAALVKTTLMMKHREIPPLLHFQAPNPKIDFETSPFYPSTKLAEWKTDGGPRRAGVSSLGVGGTNAHLILEEAPPAPSSEPTRSAQLLVLSAKSEPALDAATLRLVQHLRTRPEQSLGDIAYTLLLGRHRLEHRRVVVAETGAQAADALERLDPKRVFTGYSRGTERPVVFMFPGQGAQYAGMARGLYETEAVFRQHLDECFARLRTPLGLDLKSVLFPSAERIPAATEQLSQTAVTQPALFAVEYALAKLWMSFGVMPQAMIGHSVGEYVAAHLAGVLSLGDALDLVAERGRLMQSMPAGSMLAIHLPAAQVKETLSPDLSMAAVNAPGLCVVTGETAGIEALEEDLRRRDVPATRLHTSHAFHSAMMDPILEPFRQRVNAVKLGPPRLPYVSNLSGTWITEAEATDPAYWVRHLRETVNFARGVETLWGERDRILLEVGPGNTLGTFARAQAPRDGQPAILSSLRHPRDEEADLPFLLGALGRLWLAGARAFAAGLFAGERRRRIELPTYPFERERYWIDPDPRAAARAASAKKDPGEWFYVPTWKSALPYESAEPRNGAERTSRWLFFADEGGFGGRLVERLRAQGDVVVTVRPGRAFSGSPRAGFVIDPTVREHYDKLFEGLGEEARAIGRIVHGFGVGPTRSGELTTEGVARAHDTGFYSLLFLGQALAARGIAQPLQLKVLTSQMHDVLRGDVPHPEKSTLLGLVKVLPQEQHNVTAAAVDVEAPDSSTWNEVSALDAAVLELRNNQPGTVVAHRRQQRFVQGFEALPLAMPEPRPLRLRDGGVYLITGGLGGVTFVLAAYLAHLAKAKLVLTGRARMPERSEWEAWRQSRGDLDPISQRIVRVQALESLGAEVLVAAADVGDAAQMGEALRQAEARFGAIHGVIHGAGIVGGNTFRPIQEIGPAECEEQFHPKVAGLITLDRVLGGRDLDFCVLTSSLSSVLGGYAYGAYAAANIFMDAYAHARNQGPGPRWLSVNWDEWRLVERPADGGEHSAGLAQFAMSAAEGAGAFARLLDRRGVSQIVVSTGDLQSRMDQWVRLDVLRGAKDPKARQEAAARHARPHLQNAYVAPGSPAEQKVAHIWADLLGVEKVGIQDNFFDLGGHSLLAIQLVTRIKSELKAEISVATLFEGPTVESLCKLIGGDSEEQPGFEHSSDRGKKRKDERRRRQMERVEDTP